MHKKASGTAFSTASVSSTLSTRTSKNGSCRRLSPIKLYVACSRTSYPQYANDVQDLAIPQIQMPILTTNGAVQKTWRTGVHIWFFDSLGEICFGKAFGTSLHEDNRVSLDIMASDVRTLNIIGQMPSLKRINLDKYLLSETWEGRQKQIEFPRKQLQTRLQAKPGSEERRDVISYLQQGRDADTGESYTEPELMSEVTLLLRAGSDTANTAVTAIFYSLSCHREVLDRLTAAIRSTFPDVKSIVQGPELNSMVYLRACIDESLRLCPPIPMPLQREVLPGGIHVDGHYFPAGITVAVPNYSLHHNAKYFDRPFVYEPSQWLVKGTPGVLENEGRT